MRRGAAGPLVGAGLAGVLLRRAGQDNAPSRLTTSTRRISFRQCRTRHLCVFGAGGAGQEPL